MDEVCKIERYAVPLDRAYHPADHTWVRVEGEQVRVGMDELGQETCGDMAQLLLLPVGTVLARGDEMGTLEAQKFVGALRAPVSGVVAAVNDLAVANPRLVNTDPYGDGWLVMLRPSPAEEEEIAELVSGAPWFAAELERFRSEGSIAE
jgi:glycine cleavage system H protein